MRTGEPRPQALAAAPRTVYPRAYGGTYASNPGGPAHDGLSPCVRGNRHQRRAEGDDGRSIPVRTGEPAAWLGWKKWTTVYPRAYGGTGGGLLRTASGSGLSPCVRGNRPSTGSRGLRPGSIPVRTGEPMPVVLHHSLPKVYPRAYGGTIRCRPDQRDGRGLSPCVRGNLHPAPECPPRLRSIPVRTGEPVRSS